MYGLEKNGAKREVTTAMRVAFGALLRIPVIDGMRDTGIIIGNTAIAGSVEVGEGKMREENNIEAFSPLVEISYSRCLL